MKRRRIVTVLLLTAGLTGASSGALALGGNGTTAGGYWGCVGTRHIDLGICVQNPLPEQLPLPTTPNAPATS